MLPKDVGLFQCPPVLHDSRIEPANACFSCYDGYRFPKDDLKQSLHIT